jgi:hypothetical protein
VSKGFFKAPNAIFDNPGVELSNNEKLVYMYYLRCRNQSNEAWPSLKTIAKKCSISKGTAINVVKTLKLKHLLTPAGERGSNYSHRSNLYIVNELPGVTVGQDLVQNRAYPGVKEDLYKDPYINTQYINTYDIYDVGTLEGEPSKTPLLKKGKYGHMVKR